MFCDYVLCVERTAAGFVEIGEHVEGVVLARLGVEVLLEVDAGQRRGVAAVDLLDHGRLVERLGQPARVAEVRTEQLELVRGVSE